LATIATINLLITADHARMDKAFSESLIATRSFGVSAETALTSALTKINQNAAEMGESVSVALREGTRILAATRTEAERYEATVSRLNQLMRMGVLSQETYNRALAQAKVQTAELATETADFGEIRSRAFEAAAFLGVGLGAYELKHLTTETLESAKAANELAESLRMPVERLQGLQAAAERSSIDAQTLTTSIERMSANLGEAEIKGGNAAAAIKRLGLDVHAVESMRSDQAFLTITDAIRKMTDTAEQSRTIVELFGKSGQQLRPLLLEGSEGILKAVESAREMGYVLSQGQHESLTAAAKAMALLDQAADGLRNAFVTGLAPSIADISNKIRESLPPASQMEAEFKSLGRGISSTIGPMIDFISNNEKSIVEITEQIATVELLAFTIKKAAAAYEALSTAAEAATAMEAASAAAAALNPALMAVAAAALLAGEAYLTLKGDVQGADSAMEKMENRHKTFAQLGDQVRGAAADMAAAEKEMRDAQDNANTIAGLQDWIQATQKKISLLKQERSIMLAAPPSAHLDPTINDSEIQQLQRQIATAQKNLTHMESGNSGIGQTSAQMKEATKAASELDNALKSLLNRTESPEQKLGKDLGILLQGLAAAKISFGDFYDSIGRDYNQIVGPAVQKQAEIVARAGKEALDWQKRIEGVHKSLETPAERKADALKELEDDRKHGLTDEDYKRRLAQINSEGKSADPNHAAPGLSRQFDFFVPGGDRVHAAHKDAAKATDALHQTQKEALTVLKALQSHHERSVHNYDPTRPREYDIDHH
jgi:hypothetical protein